MTLRKISTFIFFIAISLLSCNDKSKAEFANPSTDAATRTIRISFTYLMKRYKLLQGQYIETEGILYWEFENVAICAEKGDNNKCFWLGLNNDLKINDSILQAVSGKKIILKGLVDTLSKGHIGAYVATIHNIYFIKQK